MYTQTAERAFVCPDRQGFRNGLSAVAARLGCSSRIDFNNPATSIPSLVAEHLDEVSPTCIINVFCEMMIMNHSVDAEFLNGDETVLVGNRPALLVHEIRPLVGDFVVNSCGLEDCLSSVIGAFALPAQSSLVSGEPLFGFDQESGILDSDSVGQCGEVLKTDIDADFALDGYMLFGLDIDLATEHGEPLVCIVPLYGHGLYFALGGSVEDDGHTAYLGDTEPSAGLEPETHLRVCYGFEMFLESGIAGLDVLSGFLFIGSAKEVLESLANPVVDVLENFGKNYVGISIEVFDAFVEVELAQPLAGVLVCPDADFEQLVVGSSADFKLTRKTIDLLSAWIQPELVVSQFHIINNGFDACYGRKARQTAIHPIPARYGLSCL